jgi:cell wall-associated NlpC family hydrolase
MKKGTKFRSLFTIMICAALAVAFAAQPGLAGVASVEAHAASAAADGAEAGLPEGRYVIRPLVSDTRVVTVKGGSGKSGANIYLYTGDMAKNQQFDVSYDAKGRALIRNVKSKKYISVSGGRAKNGVNVEQASGGSSNKHRWALEPAGASHGQPVFRVRSALSNRYYLQLAGGKDRDAANIRLWTKNSSRAERFVFVSVGAVAEPAAAPAIENGVYRIGSALSSSLTLAVPGGSSKSGVAPAFERKSGNALSRFFIFTYSDGYYRIRPLVNARSLTVRYGSVLAGTPVTQATEKATPHQRFRVERNADGTYRIIAKGGGLALRVTSDTARPGATLKTDYPSPAESQKFTLTPVGDVMLSSGVYSISPYAKDDLNLSIEGSSRSGGAAASVSEDGRSFAQKFTVNQRPDGAYSIENVNSQLLLTASDSSVVQSGAPEGGPSDGQLWYVNLAAGGMRFVNKGTGQAMQLTGDSGGYGVELAPPSGSTKQAFIPSETALFDAGKYRIDSRSDAGSLEVRDASFFKLADIRTDTADGSGTQAWFIRENDDGSVTIRNGRSGKPIETAGPETDSDVRQNKSSDDDAQKWFIEESGGGWYSLRSASGDNYLEANTAGENVKAVSGDGVNVTGDAPDALGWRFVPVEVKKAGPAMPKAAADAVEKEARKHLGKRYVFGAEGPKTFDCSGYIYYVLNNSGVKEMSRVTAQDIYDSCVKISPKNAKRGDLIFFKNTYKTDRTVTHLGIYLGGGRMIHAGSPVHIAKVNTKYYKAHFYAYARLA